MSQYVRIIQIHIITQSDEMKDIPNKVGTMHAS